MDTTTGSDVDSDFGDGNLGIEELNLSVRARKAARKLGCTTIGELSNHTASEFKKVKNCGAVSIAEIREKLAERGLSLLPD